MWPNPKPHRTRGPAGWDPGGPGVIPDRGGLARVAGTHVRGGGPLSTCGRTAKPSSDGILLMRDASETVGTP